MIVSKEFYAKRYALRAIMGNLESARSFLDRFLDVEPRETHVEDYSKICDVVMCSERFIANAMNNLDVLINELTDIEPEATYFVFDDKGECKAVDRETYERSIGRKPNANLSNALS